MNQKLDFTKLQMRISRTELKKSHERLQDLAMSLANLPKKYWQDLPVSAYFLDELEHLASITSPTAKNRQIKRVGKLMVDENRHILVDALFQYKFNPTQIAKINTWYYRLNVQDDNTIKQFTHAFGASEFNTIYQLLLWIEYAKFQQDEELLSESVQDLKSYIKEVALLS